MTENNLFFRKVIYNSQVLGTREAHLKLLSKLSPLQALFYCKPQQTKEKYLENTCTGTHTSNNLHQQLLRKLLMKELKTMKKDDDDDI